MARQDVLQATFEYLSGASQPIPADVFQVVQSGFPYGNWALPGVNAIYKGRTFDTAERILPSIWILVPQGDERWPMSGFKFVDYRVIVYVADMVPGNSRVAAGGAAAVYGFYGVMDALAALVRTNPTLISPSYPQGALVKFAVRSKTAESHERMENTLLISAVFNIEATEQVAVTIPS